MKTKGRKAFSLTELLVVIAIIGVLAALLIPALSGAKYHGKNTVCRSNLRQIGVAAAIYATTHGAYPHYNDYTSRLDGGWIDALEIPIVYETYKCEGFDGFRAEIETAAGGGE